MGIRERKKASTRRALVDAAARLFAERGVEATTMDDIARAAGMSRTSVFNYFGYKEMILCEIGARYVQEVAGPMLADLDNRRSSAIFEGVADSLTELAAREPALIAAVARETTHPDADRRASAQQTMGYPAVVNALLDNIEARGGLRHPEQREAYANQIVDLVSGAIVRAAGVMSRERMKSEIQSALDLFTAGAFVIPAAEQSKSA